MRTIDSVYLFNRYLENELVLDYNRNYFTINYSYPNLINPKKDCDYSNYDYFCATALTYFFIDVFIKKKKLDLDFSNYLTYVLIATICDIMPLRKINRSIAINVLKNFNIKNYYVFEKIFELKKIKRPLSLDDFGFLIGPILNSAGRLHDANIIIELFTNKDNKKKEKIIKDLIFLNEKRKNIEINMIKEFNFEKFKDNKNIIFEKNKNLNEGLIGLMANKLKDFFNKPSIVITKSNKIYKGSARSTSNFNIGKYIKNAIDVDLLMSGGGHHLAAGFSVKEKNIESFHNYLEKIFVKNKKKNSHKYISKISLKAINKKFVSNLNKLSPFGYKNENPKFLLENVKVINPKIIKNRYISFFLKSNYSKIFSAISFNLLDSSLSKNLLYNKNELNLVIEIKEDFWNNKNNIQLIVSDIIVPSNNA